MLAETVSWVKAPCMGAYLGYNSIRDNKLITIIYRYGRETMRSEEEPQAHGPNNDASYVPINVMNAPVPPVRVGHWSYQGD